MAGRRRPAARRLRQRAGQRLGARRRLSGDAGSSVVEFVLVSSLLVGLLLGVLQLAFVLHTRTVLVAAAQEGARYAANADRTPAEGAQRAREVVADAMGEGVAARLDAPRSRVVLVDGAPVVEVELSGPLPLVWLPAGPVRLTVRGHALEEG